MHIKKEDSKLLFLGIALLFIFFGIFHFSSFSFPITGNVVKDPSWECDKQPITLEGTMEEVSSEAAGYTKQIKQYVNSSLAQNLIKKGDLLPEETVVTCEHTTKVFPNSGIAKLPVKSFLKTVDHNKETAYSLRLVDSTGEITTNYAVGGEVYAFNEEVCFFSKIKDKCTFIYNLKIPVGFEGDIKCVSGFGTKLVECTGHISN